MNIHGPVEMYNIILSMGIIDKSPIFRNLANCVIDMKNCACTGRDEKIKKHQHCNKLYVDMIRSIFPSMKSEFLNRTSERQLSFYTESGELLIIVSR